MAETGGAQNPIEVKWALDPRRNGFRAWDVYIMHAHNPLRPPYLNSWIYPCVACTLEPVNVILIRS